MFCIVFSNFQDYLDLFVHTTKRERGTQSHPYKCHRGRKKVREVYVKKRRTERKDLRRGGKSEAGSGSIWLPRWSDLLNHLVTGSIPYTYGHHGRHENNKGFFLPRDTLSLLLNVCLLDQATTISSLTRHPLTS